MFTTDKTLSNSICQSFLMIIQDLWLFQTGIWCALDLTQWQKEDDVILNFIFTVRNRFCETKKRLEFLTNKLITSIMLPDLKKMRMIKVTLFCWAGDTFSKENYGCFLEFEVILTEFVMQIECCITFMSWCLGSVFIFSLV